MTPKQRQALYLAGAVVLAYLAFRFVLAYLLPFLVAVFLALLIDPIVGKLERRLHLPRGLAVLLTLLLLLAVAGLVLVTAIASLAAELTRLVDALPEYEDLAVQWVNMWTERFSFFYAGLPKPLLAALDDAEKKFYTGLAELAQQILASLQHLPDFLAFFLMVVVATFFISRDKESLAQFLLRLVPPRWREKAEEIQRNVARGVWGVLRAQALLVSLTIILTLLGLSLLEVPYAWLLALVAGFLDLAPMIGPSALFLPWIAYQLLIGNVGRALALGIVLAVILGLRQLLEPRVMATQTGLHPLATLAALYLGYRLLGASGLLI
ncbi:MAG: sporulation integral membrane protein YtvI, partial [Bacillota bacterium]|nr:sporulation integral membrane protein YtvI [Bacillota bacterium]